MKTEIPRPLVIAGVVLAVVLALGFLYKSTTLTRPAGAHTAAEGIRADLEKLKASGVQLQPNHKRD